MMRPTAALALCSLLFVSHEHVVVGQTVTSITPAVMKENVPMSFTLAGATDGHTVGIQLAGTGTCSGAQAKTVASSAVTVGSNEVAAGTYEICYWNGASGSIQSGIQILATVTNPFEFTSLSPTSVVAGVSTSFTLVSGSTMLATDKVMLVLSSAGCSTVTPGSSGTALGTPSGTSATFLWTVSGGTYDLCYTAATKSDSVTQYVQSGYTQISVVSSVAVGGSDPVARFGDKSNLFELPPYVLTPLLASPDIVVQGSVFEGSGPWEQWFDRMVLTDPVDSNRFLEIRTKPNLHQLNQSKLPRDAFRTLEATFGYGPITNPTAFTKVKGPGGVERALDFLGFDIHFRNVRRNYNPRSTSVGNFPRECADIAGHHIHLYICSAPADEYWGNQRDLSLKYAHLDLAVIEVKNFSAVTGLLPELWGVQAMSATTEGYIKRPESEEKSSLRKTKPLLSEEAAQKVVSSNTAWAGGLGMEELREGCLEQGNDTAAGVLEI